MTGQASTDCTLCGLPTPAEPHTAADAPGSYCCRGCLAVARTLDEVPDDPEDLDTGPDADDAEGEAAFLAVEGMHCATCEAFLEATATDAEGVVAADASYPAGMVRLVYDPDVRAAADLPGVVDGLGYDARFAEEARGADATDDRDLGRLLVGAFFGMMVMTWYLFVLYPSYLGVAGGDLPVGLSGTAGTFLLANVAVMATVVLGYTGYPLLRGAYVSLRAGRPNMDLLVALAATTAWAYSLVALLLGRHELYFDVTVVIVLVVTVGDRYQDRVTRRAAGRLADLAAERVGEARRRTPDGTETVGVGDVSAGEELVVRPGERVPLDGTVVEGSAAVDESLVTGESLPVRVEPGDAVSGGATVTDGALVVRVDEGATSTLDRLVGVLWEVQSATPGVQRLADRVAAAFVPLVVVLAAGATGVSLLVGAALADALLTGLAVLVVSCPCALGLATPLAVASGVRAALDRGAVLTDQSVVEIGGVDVVALDKTGTLTAGEMAVRDVAGDDATLARAAALERFSDHPVARAVVEAADPPEANVDAVETHPGRGVSGALDGCETLVGSAALFREREWPVPDDLRDRADAAREAGHAPALVGWDGRARGVVVAGDDPRAGWTEAVESLDDREVVVLTGDGEAAAARFREHPGIDETFAGVPPEGKAAVVRRLRERGRVAMVGDGSNDAPALAAADVGVAMAEGTDLAADAADVVVTTGDLRTVPATLSLLAATRRRVRQNLAWAFCYNAVAVPLALTGVLTPLLAAVAMTASSLLVVANSARSLGGGGSDGPGESATGQAAARDRDPAGDRVGGEVTVP